VLESSGPLQACNGIAAAVIIGQFTSVTNDYGQIDFLKFFSIVFKKLCKKAKILYSVCTFMSFRE
jgi:hypothetical protein